MEQIKLQYVPDGVHPVVHVSQNDVGRQFQLLLFDGNVAYSMPAGTTAQIDGIKPDGKGFSYTDAVSVSGNVVTVTTKLQMTIVAGIVTCEIRLVKNSTTIGTLNFQMQVEPSPVNGDVDISETVLPAIFELATKQMQAAEAWARGTIDGVPVSSDAEQYHNNSKYYSERSSAYADDSANSADESAYSAHLASNSAGAAANSAKDSEAWARGSRNNVDVPTTDITYHNNSKYYSEQSLMYYNTIKGLSEIIHILIGNVYLAAENGDHLLTESGDNLILDY